MFKITTKIYQHILFSCSYIFPRSSLSIGYIAKQVKNHKVISLNISDPKKKKKKKKLTQIIIVQQNYCGHPGKLFHEKLLLTLQNELMVQ